MLTYWWGTFPHSSFIGRREIKGLVDPIGVVDLHQAELIERTNDEERQLRQIVHSDPGRLAIYVEPSQPLTRFASEMRAAQFQNGPIRLLSTNTQLTRSALALLPDLQSIILNEPSSADLEIVARTMLYGGKLRRLFVRQDTSLVRQAVGRFLATWEEPIWVVEHIAMPIAESDIDIAKNIFPNAIIKNRNGK